MTRGRGRPTPATHRARRGARRPRSIAFVAGWLTLLGVFEFVSAPFIPALPPLALTPWPILHEAAGVVAVLAGAGTWWLKEWGRWLAAGYVGYALVYLVGRWSGLVVDAALVDLALPVIWVALDAAALWILVSRWPSGGRDHHA